MTPAKKKADELVEKKRPWNYGKRKPGADEAAELYAQKKAVDFAEWLVNGYQPMGIKRTVWVPNNSFSKNIRPRFTTEELYKKFNEPTP
jgi:hypothetical protein